MLNRRPLQVTAAFAFAAFHRTALAEDQIAVPIVFVHGDSDAAGIWQTAIWAVREQRLSARVSPSTR